MAHDWDRGVLNASSWHGLEELGTFATSADMIAHGERTGAWPVAVQLRALQVAGFECEPPTEQAVVASYVNHRARSVGVVGSRYTATTPESWRSLVQAAEKAGAKPTGAFSLIRFAAPSRRPQRGQVASLGYAASVCGAIVLRAERIGASLRNPQAAA